MNEAHEVVCRCKLLEQDTWTRSLIEILVFQRFIFVVVAELFLQSKKKIYI